MVIYLYNRFITIFTIVKVTISPNFIIVTLIVHEKNKNCVSTIDLTRIFINIVDLIFHKLNFVHKLNFAMKFRKIN